MGISGRGAYKFQEGTYKALCQISVGDTLQPPILRRGQKPHVRHIRTSTGGDNRLGWFGHLEGGLYDIVLFKFCIENKDIQSC